MFEIYFHGWGWGWLDKSIIILISAPVGFELGLGAELGNKGARDMLNKHRILLTENFGKTLDYQILYLAMANIWGRSAVPYGLKCSQACFY